MLHFRGLVNYLLRESSFENLNTLFRYLFIYFIIFSLLGIAGRQTPKLCALESGLRRLVLCTTGYGFLDQFWT